MNPSFSVTQCIVQSLYYGSHCLKVATLAVVSVTTSGKSVSLQDNCIVLYCSGRLFYTTILMVKLLRRLRVKADSAALAAIPVCREPVSTPFSPVSTLSVLLSVLTACFPSVGTDPSHLTTGLFTACRRRMGYVKRVDGKRLETVV